MVLFFYSMAFGLVYGDIMGNAANIVRVATFTDI